MLSLLILSLFLSVRWIWRNYLKFSLKNHEDISGSCGVAPCLVLTNLNDDIMVFPAALRWHTLSFSQQLVESQVPMCSMQTRRRQGGGFVTSTTASSDACGRHQGFSVDQKEFWILSMFMKRPDIKSRLRRMHGGVKSRAYA